MAKAKFAVSTVVAKLLFILAAALLTGFLTVLFARFLGRYISPMFAAATGVALAVTVSLWFSQAMKHPPFLLSGTSPLVAGLCAGLGVYISRVWLP